MNRTETEKTTSSRPGSAHERSASPANQQWTRSLINSVGMFAADKAGAFGDSELGARVSGIMGSCLEESKEAAKDFLKKKTTEEEVKARISKAFEKSTLEAARVTAKKGVDTVSNLLKKKLPGFTLVIEMAAELAKSEIVPKVVEIANKVIQKTAEAMNRVGDKLKSWLKI